MDIHEEKIILGIWCTIIIFILAYEIAFAYKMMLYFESYISFPYILQIIRHF